MYDIALIVGLLLVGSIIYILWNDRREIVTAYPGLRWLASDASITLIGSLVGMLLLGFGMGIMLWGNLHLGMGIAFGTLIAIAIFAFVVFTICTLGNES